MNPKILDATFSELEQFIYTTRDELCLIISSNNFAYVDRSYISPVEKKISEVHERCFQYICRGLMVSYEKKNELTSSLVLVDSLFNGFDARIVAKLKSENICMVNCKRRKKYKGIKRRHITTVEIRKHSSSFAHIIKMISTAYKRILGFIFSNFHMLDIVDKAIYEDIIKAIGLFAEDTEPHKLEKNKFSFSLLELTRRCFKRSNELRSNYITKKAERNEYDIRINNLDCHMLRVIEQLKSMNCINLTEFETNKQVLNVMLLKLYQLKDMKEDKTWYEDNKIRLFAGKKSYFNEYNDYLEDPAQFFAASNSLKLRSKLSSMFSNSQSIFGCIKFFIYAFHLYPILNSEKRFRYSFTKINKTRLDELHGKHKLLLHIIFWLLESALAKYVSTPVKKLDTEMLKLLRIFTCWIKSNRCVLQFAHRRDKFCKLLENFVKLVWRFQPRLENFSDIHRPCRPAKFEEDIEVKGVIAFNCDLSDFNDDLPGSESSEKRQLFYITELVSTSDDNFLRLQALYISVLKFLGTIK